MKTLRNIGEIEDVNSILKDYVFQPELTEKLDNTECDFTQSIINEIVLWKVNRYAKLSEDSLSLLNKIDNDSTIINIELTKELLHGLLTTKGIRLPMASTILRFKASKIYQIYDQRVFRYLYGIDSRSSTIVNKQINMYMKYLVDLREECSKNNINFEMADRILYQADKIQNSSMPIKY